MDYRINPQTYEILYARYLNPKRIYEMVNMARDLTGKKVADFCCGNGRLSRVVLHKHPKFLWAVDESKDMLNWIVPYNDQEFLKWTISVDTALNFWSPRSIDVIFCQQAINYWFLPEDVPLIKKLLAPKGLFIFNTFHNKPFTRPVYKSYCITNRNYVEISWRVKNMVKHGQTCTGCRRNGSSFYGIPLDTPQGIS